MKLGGSIILDPVEDLLAALTAKLTPKKQERDLVEKSWRAELNPAQCEKGGYLMRAGINMPADILVHIDDLIVTLNNKLGGSKFGGKK